MANSKLYETGISVIMPTYNQESFISLAIESLLKQTYKNWQLIIINDGGTDETNKIVESYKDETRIKLYNNKENLGLGKCLNTGILYAQYEIITYLPSDDIIFPNHLETLLIALKSCSNSILSFSGIVQVNYDVMGTKGYNYKRIIKNKELQLAQVMHYKCELRWMEREECTTNDYNLMYWDKLMGLGDFIPTNETTCQLINHPDQRSNKVKQGLNIYRSYYNVKTPLIFHPKGEGKIDEKQIYESIQRKETNSTKGLKILIVGELSFNPERICAFEEAGHKLYGLWIENGWWFHSIGPLPFGNVKDISKDNWEEEIKDIKPDIIYGLLCCLVAPLVSKVVKTFPEIPFIWHLKESPFYARENGLWNDIHYLFKRADAIIYINDDIKGFYETCFPKIRQTPFLIMDGELPKQEWFKNRTKPRLSETQGGYHTLVPGRPYGLTPEHVKALAENNIHLHFYGESWHKLYESFARKAAALAPCYLHLHQTCTQENWTEEFSQYDAGWLHFFESKNEGNSLKFTWEDVNIPARMATLVAAGLPMLQRDNSGHIVATQTICKNLGIGIFFKEMSELSGILSNHNFMNKIRENTWLHRKDFVFDSYMPVLIEFFKKAIELKKL